MKIPDRGIPHSCVLLHSGEQDDEVVRSRKLAEFLGIPVRAMSVASFRNAPLPENACIITTANVLSALDELLLTYLLSTATHLFLHGFASGADHASLLAQLTEGVLTGVGPLPPGNALYSVNPDSRDVCGPFSGLTFGNVDAVRDLTFVRSSGNARVIDLIRVLGQPFFVQVETARCSMFLLARSQLTDFDTPAEPGTSLLSYFGGIAPAMMFMRWTFRQYCWHPATATACLIIDDPLLRPRYGYLEYACLLERMKARGFATSIAFIPWNYRKTDLETAALIKAHPRHYSICVHGCDHTGGEFAMPQQEALRGKVAAALSRMEQHSALTGIPFDRIMVFPHGRFSTSALKVLAESKFIAVVNTTPWATDFSDEPLRLRDLLDVVVTRYCRFPLFVRHYPRELAEFAFDLFLGKPALIVEHHDYFRNGHEHLEQFVEAINALQTPLHWCGVQRACTLSHLIRDTGKGTHEVKFFTDCFQFTNRQTESKCFSLMTRVRDLGQRPLVKVNGGLIPSSQQGDWLQFQIELSSGAALTAELEYEKPRWKSQDTYISWLQKAKVFARREASEIRDNYPMVSKVAQTYKRLFST